MNSPAEAFNQQEILHFISKPPGAVFGVQGSPCPSESPVTFERYASIGTGYLFAHVTQNLPEKCTALYNQNERGEKL